MPRYFFHYAGNQLHEDDNGILLAGPEDARFQAVTAVADLLKDLGGTFWDGPERQIYVTDEDGRVVCAIHVRGVVET